MKQYHMHVHNFDPCNGNCVCVSFRFFPQVHPFRGNAKFNLAISGPLKETNDDVTKWKHFPRYWPIHRWISLTKASDAELWCFLWSAPWINGWVNSGETGDLRRHHVHYDVIVMNIHQYKYQYTQAGISDWHSLFQVNKGMEFQVILDMMVIMMTPSNGNIFRVTGHLCGNSPVTG